MRSVLNAWYKNGGGPFARWEGRAYATGYQAHREPDRSKDREWLPGSFMRKGNDMSRSRLIAALSMAAVAFLSSAVSAQTPNQPVGVVSNIKVLTDKWPDVSSLGDWKKSYIKEGMTDKDKALAIFNTEVTYQITEGVPKEYLQRDKDVVNPIKLFNVYGATWCSVSAANVMCLARYCGMPAKGSTINNHCILEIFYNNAVAHVRRGPHRVSTRRSTGRSRRCRRSWTASRRGSRSIPTFPPRGRTRSRRATSG